MPTAGENPLLGSFAEAGDESWGSSSTHYNRMPNILLLRYVVAFTRFAGGGIWLPQESLRHILAFLGTPVDNRGKCYTDGKGIQCLSNASQHVPVCLQPFTIAIASYWSKIATFSYPLHLTPQLWVFYWNSGKKFGPQKTRIGYQAVKTIWRYVEPFRHNTSVWRTDRQTGGRTAYSYYVRSITDAR